MINEKYFSKMVPLLKEIFEIFYLSRIRQRVCSWIRIDYDIESKSLIYIHIKESDVTNTIDYYVRRIQNIRSPITVLPIKYKWLYHVLICAPGNCENFLTTVITYYLLATISIQ